MGSGSSRPGEAEGGAYHGPGEAAKQMEAFLFAVHRLASSNPSEAMAAAPGEAPGVDDVACSSSLASTNLLRCKDPVLQWDSLLLSLGESAVRPFSLSTPFLWNEVLRPLLLGNPRNGQVKALYLFFARTISRYAEAVEALHRRHSCSPFPSQGVEPRREDHRTQAANQMASSESPNEAGCDQDAVSSVGELVPDTVPFPCTDLSVAELALLLRLLTKALCTQLSLPQLLYHLEYVSSSADSACLSSAMRDELFGLSQAFFASLGSKRQRSSSISFQAINASESASSNASPSFSRLPPNAVSQSSSPPVPDAASAPSRSRPARRGEDKEELNGQMDFHEASGLRCSLSEMKQSDEAPQFPISSPPLASPAFVGADPTTTPTTTATLDSAGGAEASKRASCVDREASMEKQWAPSASLSSPAFCAFVMSYRGATKLFSASPLRPPEQLQNDVIAWLSLMFPEDAVAAKARGFLFRATLRPACSGSSRGSSEGRNGSVEESREVFLSVNDLASVRTLSSVLVPVRLGDQATGTAGPEEGDTGIRSEKADVKQETGGDSAEGEGQGECRDRSGEGEEDGEQANAEEGTGDVERSRLECVAVSDRCTTGSNKDLDTQYGSSTILVAFFTVVPLWIPLSPAHMSASSSCSSSSSLSSDSLSVSTIGSVLDAIVRFLTIAQPPSPCCSPNLLRAHQHLQELLLCLFAVVCPPQLTASCVPRSGLAPVSSRRKRPLQTPHPRPACVAGEGEHTAGGLAGEGGVRSRDWSNRRDGDTFQPVVETGAGAGREMQRMGSRHALVERENSVSFGEKAGRRQPKNMLIPPLSSPCAKLAPALYVWQQEAQQERFARMREEDSEREEHEERVMRQNGKEERRRNNFPPVAAAALLPDLYFIEVLLSRWDRDKRGEDRAKEFAAYLLSMVWPSSAFLMSSPAFVSIPPGLAHCSLSLVLLLAFYPHPSTRVSLLMARAPHSRMQKPQREKLGFIPSSSVSSTSPSPSPASLSCVASSSSPRCSASGTYGWPGLGGRPLPSTGKAFSGSPAASDDVSLARRTPTEANVFAIAFSCLYDASHFSVNKPSRADQERMPAGSSPRHGDSVSPDDSGGSSPSLPPSSSVNFEGLLLQLCAPSSLSHPLKSLLLYLLLCRNRCFRLFCLSRSDGERVVIPLLQMLNALPRLSPSKAGDSEGDEVQRPRAAAPPIAVICAISLATLSKDKSFCSELQRKVITDIPWEEKKKLADASLGSLVILVLLRLLSWNIRRCGDSFFLLLCSSSLLNVAASVEHLHWYVADRLVDYAAALLRLLARRLAGLSSCQEETLAVSEDREERVETNGDSDRIRSAALRSQHRRERQRRQREAEQLEFSILACRAVLQFLSIALRPPLLNRNLSLLYALLRLFPVCTAKTLLENFTVACTAAERSSSIAEEEKQVSLASPVASSLPLNSARHGGEERNGVGSEEDREYEREGRSQCEGETNEKGDQCDAFNASFEVPATVARVAFLIGAELKLLLDLVEVFSSSIDDAIRQGSAVEEDGETSRRVVEQLAAKIPPPGHSFSHCSGRQPHPCFLSSSSSREDECIQGEGGRKRQIDRLRESYLACAAPGRPDFVESWGSSSFFLPIIWRSIDALTPDTVCWDRPVSVGPRT
ncbi:dyggve-melchior-clausen syndrome protein [Toxoplasma gondii RUB]|uniref:Dymeclin n=1 Tax=Toxoplasma gondii RUB TaxID=935652 RepID=A0A086M9A6_TOXGO|nr:dyggve-melchior-clausen syndrome protein [Toxoplasma gondii RUB]